MVLKKGFWVRSQRGTKEPEEEIVLIEAQYLFMCIHYSVLFIL